MTGESAPRHGGLGGDAAAGRYHGGRHLAGWPVAKGAASAVLVGPAPDVRPGRRSGSSQRTPAWRQGCLAGGRPGAGHVTRGRRVRERGQGGKRGVRGIMPGAAAAAAAPKAVARRRPWQPAAAAALALRSCRCVYCRASVRQDAPWGGRWRERGRGGGGGPCRVGTDRS